MDLRLILDIAAVLFALVSMWAAIKQSRKARSARKAEQAVWKKLSNRRAADEFSEMARNAASLTVFIGNMDWSRGRELGVHLRGSLSRASGGWNHFLRENEMDKLGAAISQLSLLLQLIPLTNRDENEEQRIREMMNQSGFVMEVANEIAGRLKYLAESEET